MHFSSCFKWNTNPQLSPLKFELENQNYKNENQFICKTQIKSHATEHKE